MLRYVDLEGFDRSVALVSPSVVVFSEEKHDQIGILIDGAILTQVG